MGGKDSYKFTPETEGVDEEIFTKGPDISRIEEKEKEQEQGILNTIVNEAGKEALEKSIVSGTCVLFPGLAPAIQTAYGVYKSITISNNVRKTFNQLDGSTKEKITIALLREAVPEIIAEGVSELAFRPITDFAEATAVETMRMIALDKALTVLGMTSAQTDVAFRIVSRTFSGLIRGTLEGTLKGGIKASLERAT